jgi:2-methylcitrate dehydratase PrpD
VVWPGQKATGKTELSRLAHEAEAEKLAAFVCRASYDAFSPYARQQLKIRLLDSIGCAIGGRSMLRQ